MPKYYYHKVKKKNFRNLFRFFALIILIFGIFSFIYTFFPLISWQVYFAPTLTENLKTPIPKLGVVNPYTLQSLISNAANLRMDYTKPQNWFPSYKIKDEGIKSEFYSLSIPSLGIKNALVSTSDYELDKHLVNYGGTATPPENGNAVIFGHSTLPQLFNPSDYKTIFATLYKLKVGDEFFTTVDNVTYKYRIHNISVVDPSDTSIFSQQLDTSHVTLVTCTPPGTTWKRLIIKSILEKI